MRRYGLILCKATRHRHVVGVAPGHRMVVPTLAYTQEMLVPGTCIIPVPATEIASIYNQRWEIEESYKVKKCRLRIEDISGKTPEIARQDLHARVFTGTVTAAILLEHREQIEQDNLNKKIDYKTRFKQALAKMKNELAIAILEVKARASA